MVNTGLTVVIVGGSLSGLFAGLMLRHLGHSVHILERHTAEQLQDQGAGLRLGPDVLKFLAEYVQSQFPAVGCGELIVLDSSGDAVHAIALDPKISQFASWAVLHRTLRAAFDQPTKGAAEYSYRYCCTVENVAEREDQVEVSYTCHGELNITYADLVIAADGASSRIRQQFLPNVARTYSGYFALRGIVPESELSSSAKQSLVERTSWFFGSDFAVISYPIPGEDGAINEGKRLVNWAWYINCTEEELADVMTDCEGVKRTLALPLGTMRPEVTARIKVAAKEIMPPQLVELVDKTVSPFVQVVTDLRSPENKFLAGKVVLIGDAMAGARPHIGAATSQIVYHVSKLKEVLEGRATIQQWSETTLSLSSLMCETSQELGQICQSAEVPAPQKFLRFSAATRKMFASLAAANSA